MKILSNEQRVSCIFYAVNTMLALNLVWMGLEQLIYGAVQHRFVDDIIAIPLYLITYMMWKYKTERDNLRKGWY